MKVADISDKVALEAAWPCGRATPEIPIVKLALLSHAPAKVCERKFEKLVKRGLIEYGTSIAYCWRTEEGEAELERLA